MASVCASKDTGPKGTLQYRFGKLDGSEPLEQILPEGGQVAPAQAASGESVAFSGGGPDRFGKAGVKPGKDEFGFPD